MKYRPRVSLYADPSLPSHFLPVAMNRLLSSSFALLFSITTAFPVEPVKGRIEIGGESGDQVLEASRDQPVIQEAPQFGSLLIQTVPVNCVISIPSLKVDQSPKIMNDWRISNIPAGTYSVTFAALDKTLQSDVRIRRANPLYS